MVLSMVEAESACIRHVFTIDRVQFRTTDGTPSKFLARNQSTSPDDGG
jgi:hypothetical protein